MNFLEKARFRADQVIGGEEIENRVASGKTLRVKLGVDPTRPDLTFGHLVVFNKLRQFHDLGHQAILIIGDFTTRIGDPSGRSSTRPVLTVEEINSNAETYLEQAFRILDAEKTEVRRNSEWFSEMSFADCLDLSRKMTVARMLERDDFSKRHKDNTPISIVEFLYPLIQGYDSLMINADIELGGSDQLFNMLVGRALQKDAGQPEQAVLTMPLLVGLDGSKKMSKSADNFIAFNDSPKDMFGKIMSIEDSVIKQYAQYCLFFSDEKVSEFTEGHPMVAKKRLARELVSRFHGDASGEKALTEFETVFSRREIPADMPVFSWATLALPPEAGLRDLLAATDLFGSKKEIVRLISQGAVKIDGEKADNPALSIQTPDTAEGIVFQSGKRLFFRLTA